MQAVSKVTAALAAAVLAGGLVAGCSSDGTATGSGSDAPVSAVTPAPGEVSLVGPAAFAATVDAGGVTVIDVRTPQEFAAGHIEGAINIDLQDPTAFTQQVAALDPGQPYAVYCRSGNRSATATAYMIDQGFQSIVELDGGTVAWQSDGLPLVG